MQPIVFPIDQPVMPETRQIGRRPSIDRLEKKLSSPAHIWLIGERRIGKTSVAKAVFARSRRADSVALDIDLSRPGVDSPAALAGDIARQAQAGGAGTESTGRRILGLGRRESGRVKGLGDALGELGFANAADALGASAALLAGGDDGSPGLERTLGALALHARATGRRVWILLDEVHLLARLAEAERTIAHYCHQEGCPIVFLFSGSEESSVDALRAAGRPLTAIGEEFALPEIAWEDWMAGLAVRFTEAGVTIGEKELYALLEASAGHPRRTMMVAARIHDSALAEPDRHADATLVELAIREARGDRSWT
jgi:hypothetical protein